MISHAPIIIQKSINIYVKRLFLILPLTQFTMTIDKERLLASPFKIIASNSQNKVHVDNTIFSKLYLSYTINMLKSKPRINPIINSKSHTGWRNHCNIKCTCLFIPGCHPFVTINKSTKQKTYLNSLHQTLQLSLGHQISLPKLIETKKKHQDRSTQSGRFEIKVTTGDSGWMK